MSEHTRVTHTYAHEIYVAYLNTVWLTRCRCQLNVACNTCNTTQARSLRGYASVEHDNRVMAAGAVLLHRLDDVSQREEPDQAVDTQR